MQHTPAATFEAALKETIDFAAHYAPDTILAMLHPVFCACDHAARSSHVLYETKPWMWNGGGVTHGGLVATMFDNAMGILVRSYFQQKSVTVNLQVNYLAAVPTNITLHIAPRILYEENGLVTLQADGWVQDASAPVATASARFKLLGPLEPRAIPPVSGTVPVSR